MLNQFLPKTIEVLEIENQDKCILCEENGCTFNKSRGNDTTDILDIYCNNHNIGIMQIIDISDGDKKLCTTNISFRDTKVTYLIGYNFWENKTTYVKYKVSLKSSWIRNQEYMYQVNAIVNNLDKFSNFHDVERYIERARTFM